MAEAAATLTHGRAGPEGPSRVVILGARGFIAGALARRLASEGQEVLAVSSGALDLADPESGRRLAELLRDGDAVVATAALTPERGRDTATLIRNLRMAESIAAAIAARSLGHVIYFSSDSVYGGAASVISEATPAAPADLYGLMHRAREIALKEASDRAKVPFCILRPCAVYGPGDTHNSYGPNRFIREALKGGRIQVFGLGEETRDHVFIDDVADLTTRVIRQASAGVLNLASGETVSFGDLARRIAKLSGGNPAIESLERRGPVTHRAFDTAALRAAFPSFKPTPLDTGLRTTVAVCRSS